jgi:hypothetical protein
MVLLIFENKKANILHFSKSANKVHPYYYLPNPQILEQPLSLQSQ